MHVILLDAKSLERCYIVDSTLARLARLYSNTKFLRVRAAVLGFAKKSSASSTMSKSRYQDKDGDDPYGEEGEEEEDDIEEDYDIDLDVLPTMLVYRDGELIHNWVRVDWEAGHAGIEELLDKLAFELTLPPYSILILRR